MKYIHNLLKVMTVMFVLGLAPICAQGQTCEEALQEAKKAYKENIEREFVTCGEDDKCINKVSRKAKKHPYLSQYKKCKRAE